ncbi:MAG: BREX-1 system phosphatase PglZ type B [Candidatus Eisenbacteria sp.]|nr:BREX-1 system phosphatase PglZ type B [Candidatus Eisenbacteria bacterium]
MQHSTQQHATLLEAVKASVTEAGRFNPADMVAPAAILWTDPDGQWRPVVKQLRPLLPELLTLGEFDPDTRTGPAIWLRCAIERTLPETALPEITLPETALPETTLPETAIPIIYMPEVGRQRLRAAEDCPDAIKPLVELQFRGTTWTQKNGKDWTVEAFLVSEDGGLALDLVRDGQTRQAMLGALSVLTTTSLSWLRGRRLTAKVFDEIVMGGDIPRDLLLWLGDPGGMRAEWGEDAWSAFRSRCRDEYAFDPEDDGEIVGGEKLGLGRDAWLGIWQRYVESPVLYPGIPDLLKRAKPTGELIFEKQTWPDENEMAEDTLRRELLALGDAPATVGREKITALEKEHGPRRDWVWAKLGRSPLAQALEYLTILSERTAQAVGGDSPEFMAQLYVEGAYRADDAALRALAAVKSAEDVQAVKAAVRCLYLPWLEDTARHLQTQIAATGLERTTDGQVREVPGSYGSSALPGPRDSGSAPVAAEQGECLLFVDGLRFDIAQRLADAAAEGGLRVAIDWRWAALPTVTATAKPAVSPIAEELVGHRPESGFQPETIAGRQVVNTARFRKLLSASGHQILAPSETGDPRGAHARGWTEYGEFDKLGHNLQAQLAARIDDQLDLLLQRITDLITSGWRRVRVVTDHGWLLMPGGLPAIQLPKYLTESRWSRCASIKDSSHIDVPTAPWHWNRHERFAYGPGVHCFLSGNEYAHGGVSLQECLIPDLRFAAGSQAAPREVTITDIQWRGLRCRVNVEATGAPVAVEAATARITADLRTKPNDPSSSVTEPKVLDQDGRAGLLVEDDSLEGTIVSLVLLDPSGQVMGKAATTIGGEE